MGHHLCLTPVESDPKHSLHLTFHRLWPNTFLVIISATTILFLFFWWGGGGSGNEQWMDLTWFQGDLNWALVSLSDSLLSSPAL